MPFYKDLEKRKEEIRIYLRKNPTATFRDIKKYLHTKINKVYSGGMEEAFKDAGIPSPRTFERKTIEEKKEMLFDYLKSHPYAGGHTIRKATKINFQTIFKDTKELFDAAGLAYPREENAKLRKRDQEQKRLQIINMVKENPLINLEELASITNTHIYTLFKNIKEIYDLAGIKYLGKGAKRKIKKQKEVIEFVRQNNFATQREINTACKTHVQLLFKRGIFEAYEQAEIQFPFERLKIHGTAIKKIKEDANRFEEETAKKLSGYGRVNRLVKTKRGFADIILERKNKKVVIELKNYKVHEISISQIKQLNKYLEDINCNLGFLICLKKPRKDTFLMGKNKIYILLESEIDKIPELIDKDP